LASARIASSAACGRKWRRRRVREGRREAAGGGGGAAGGGRAVCLLELEEELVVALLRLRRVDDEGAPDVGAVRLVPRAERARDRAVVQLLVGGLRRRLEVEDAAALDDRRVARLEQVGGELDAELRRVLEGLLRLVGEDRVLLLLVLLDAVLDPLDQALLHHHRREDRGALHARHLLVLLHDEELGERRPELDLREVGLRRQRRAPPRREVADRLLLAEGRHHLRRVRRAQRGDERGVVRLVLVGLVARQQLERERRVLRVLERREVLDCGEGGGRGGGRRARRVCVRRRARPPK
jgi:hypothetical protein